MALPRELGYVTLISIQQIHALDRGNGVIRLTMLCASDSRNFKYALILRFFGGEVEVARGTAMQLTVLSDRCSSGLVVERFHAHDRVT